MRCEFIIRVPMLRCRANGVPPMQNGNATIIVMYRVFDDDQSGTMDFGEFVLATNCTSLSDPQAKVR